MIVRWRATPAAVKFGVTSPIVSVPTLKAELRAATPAAYGAKTRDEAERWLTSGEPVAGMLATSSLRGSYLHERYEALRCALTRPCVARHEEPGELTSTANMRGASRQAAMAKASGTKAKRAMGERIARTFIARGGLTQFRSDWAFAVVVITRIAPRLLDSDNLEAACKALRDGIAAGLGIDDRSSLVRYVVSQEQGAPRERRVRAELFIQEKP